MANVRMFMVTDILADKHINVYGSERKHTDVYLQLTKDNRRRVSRSSKSWRCKVHGVGVTFTKLKTDRTQSRYINSKGLYRGREQREKPSEGQQVRHATNCEVCDTGAAIVTARCLKCKGDDSWVSRSGIDLLLSSARNVSELSDLVISDCATHLLLSAPPLYPPVLP